VIASSRVKLTRVTFVVRRRVIASSQVKLTRVTFVVRRCVIASSRVKLTLRVIVSLSGRTLRGN